MFRDTSIFDAKIHKAVSDMCLESIVSEAFIESLPIEKYEITDDLAHSLATYATECMQDLGSMNLLREAMETTKDPAKRAYLKRVYTTCMETATTVTARILEETSGDPDALEDAAKKVTLTPEEYNKFSKAAASLTPTSLTNMIKQKTLDTIKEEKEAYQKDEELAQELQNALADADDDEDDDDVEPISTEPEEPNSGEAPDVNGAANDNGEDAPVDDNPDATGAAIGQSNESWTSATEGIDDLKDKAVRMKNAAQYAIGCKIHGVKRYNAMEEVEYCIKNNIPPLTKDEVRQYEEFIMSNPDSELSQMLEFGNYKIIYYKNYPIWCVGKNDDLCVVMARSSNSSEFFDYKLVGLESEGHFVITQNDATKKDEEDDDVAAKIKIGDSYVSLQNISMKNEIANYKTGEGIGQHRTGVDGPLDKATEGAVADAYVAMKRNGIDMHMIPKEFKDQARNLSEADRAEQFVRGWNYANGQSRDIRKDKPACEDLIKKLNNDGCSAKLGDLGGYPTVVIEKAPPRYVNSTKKYNIRTKSDVEPPQQGDIIMPTGDQFAIMDVREKSVIKLAAYGLYMQNKGKIKDEPLSGATEGAVWNLVKAAKRAFYDMSHIPQKYKDQANQLSDADVRKLYLRAHDYINSNAGSPINDKDACKYLVDRLAVDGIKAKIGNFEGYPIVVITQATPAIAKPYQTYSINIGPGTALKPNDAFVPAPDNEYIVVCTKREDQLEFAAYALWMKDKGKIKDEPLSGATEGAILSFVKAMKWALYDMNHIPQKYKDQANQLSDSDARKLYLQAYDYASRDVGGIVNDKDACKYLVNRLAVDGVKAKLGEFEGYPTVVLTQATPNIVDPYETYKINVPEGTAFKPNDTLAPASGNEYIMVPNKRDDLLEFAAYALWMKDKGKIKDKAGMESHFVDVQNETNNQYYTYGSQIGQHTTECCRSKKDPAKKKAAFEAYMRSLSGDNYRAKHSSVFSRLQELSYEGLSASTESYKDIPFDTMTAITKQNTFKRFNSNGRTDLHQSLENISRYAFESAATPDGPDGDDHHHDHGQVMNDSLLVASIIYTFFETLNSMNLYCPKLDEIRQFVDESLPVEAKVVKEQEGFMHMLKHMLHEAHNQVNKAATPVELDAISKDMDIVRERAAAPGFESMRAEIYANLDKMDQEIKTKRERIAARQKPAIPAMESSFQTAQRTRDMLKFSRVASTMGRKPNVSMIKCKVDPQKNSKYVAVECYTANNKLANTTSIVLEAALPDDIADYVTRTIQSSKLMDLDKQVIVTDARSGKRYYDSKR